MMRDVYALRDLAWFAEMTKTQLDRVEAGTLHRRFVPNQRLMDRGDPGSSVLFVLSGRILAVHWTPGGREIVYSDIGPGNMAGEVSVISGSPRSLSLYARSDGAVLEMPARLFLDLVETHPPLRRALMLGLVRRVQNLTQRVHDLTMLGIEDRLRAYLLRTALEQGALQPGGVLSDPPSHAEIANIIGANREAVSRGLATLNRQGAIESGRKFLRILQPDALLATME